MHKFRKVVNDVRSRVGPAHVDVGEVLSNGGIKFVPLSEACQACDDPCEEFGDLGAYPSRFGIDTASQLLGTTKPYSRQVRQLVISLASFLPHHRSTFDICLPHVHIGNNIDRCL